MERRMDRRERERERSRQSNFNDRVDLDSRTPLAWQHRDFNYQQHSQSAFNDRYPEGIPSSSSDRFSHPSLGSRSARSAAAAVASDRSGVQQRQSESEQTGNRMPPARGVASKKASTSSAGTGIVEGGGRDSSSGGAGGANRNSARPSRSSEETTTGSSSETETDAERGQPSRPGTSGTLRSMQSMPLLSPLHHPAAFNPALGGIYGVVGMPHQPGNPTWNGEPCPVHGAGIPPHMPSHMPMAHYQTPHGAIAAAYPPIYSSMSMKRAVSIHEMAMATPLPALMPPPGPIYGTLPHGPPHQFLMPAPPSNQEPTHFVMMTGPPSMMGPPASSIGGRKTRHVQRSGPGSLPPMPPPSQMATLQHQRGMRPLVVNGKNGQPEPLPVRDAPPLPPKIPPSDVASKTASKASSAKPFSYNACCKGNVIVLWVILGIIGLGVVMAVVFYYAFQ